MLDEKQRDITILCKVVDNFGDIGFVFRLARSITEGAGEAKLRLVVSDLPSFSKLEPKIDSTKSSQIYDYQGNEWQVFDWNCTAVCKAEFRANRPRVILECFQCARPEWLDEILFDENQTNITHIINIEYLTAEDWADDFHLLKSGTRSAFVKKVNFMPGFTAKTGGLVLDNSFMKCLTDREYAKSLLKYEAKIEVNDDDFNVVVFSYERDFSPVVRALSSFADVFQKQGKCFRIFVADGKNKKVFQDALLKSGNDILLKNSLWLPFLTQQTWDALITLSDFNFVRGEDSLSRAVLAGKPFAWHAYPQENER